MGNSEHFLPNSTKKMNHCKNITSLSTLTAWWKVNKITKSSLAPWRYIPIWHNPDFQLHNNPIYFPLAKEGMNVVILSRTKASLDRVAKEIGNATGQKVKVIVADFTKDNVFSEIEDQLKDLSVGVLVNNVGIIPSIFPSKLLECADLEQVSDYNSFFCFHHYRGKGVILNISSGFASVPVPYYILYSASKAFIERFSQGLQAEYRDKGIIIQVVAPFGVSTRMTFYQKASVTVLTSEDFVKSSLQYLRAGDKTNGSVCHIIMVRLQISNNAK
uniref:Hydroxysteroid (17-beta) dehydrogenase 3 n=1 Tax=Monopterus albus TaxID=43700 RepID=A0A3Q3K7X7_MONAL